jgi:hypothetical protein
MDVNHNSGAKPARNRVLMDVKIDNVTETTARVQEDALVDLQGTDVIKLSLWTKKVIMFIVIKRKCQI